LQLEAISFSVPLKRKIRAGLALVGDIVDFSFGFGNNANCAFTYITT